jgi:hypothetical protein
MILEKELNVFMDDRENLGQGLLREHFSLVKVLFHLN